MGQIMFFGAKPDGKPQLCRETARSFHGQVSDTKLHCEELGFHASRKKCFHAALSSTSTVLPRSDERELRTQPLWGRQEAAAFPPPHPDISPGSLQPLWKRSTADFSLPASHPKKCRKKVSFPQQVLTGLAETCAREIGRSAHQYALSEERAQSPPPHSDTSPQGCCWH